MTVPLPVAAAVERDLRANPAYRLHPWESLPEGYRRALEADVDPGAVAGVLVAGPGSALPDKLVGHRGAELFAVLAHPGRAPEVPAATLAELVLDGVLEIEACGGFVSGPAAAPLLLEPRTPVVGDDRLSRLSLAALEHAARLPGLAPAALTARLYGFGRVPVSGRWQRAYPGPHAVLDLLRLAGVERHWSGEAEPGPDTEWLSWRRPGPAELPYKLYVSPHVDDLGAALPAAVEALAATPASVFKVGVDATGLLRPDKFVVYLRDAAELTAVAADLAAALAGVRPHGVPFSAGLHGDGLLSWGGDPPAGTGPVGLGPESWRLSVCRRLAEHLTAADAGEPLALSPSGYALARLAADGVRLPAFAPAALPAPAP
jgi:hypothetical protein